MGWPGLSLRPFRSLTCLFFGTNFDCTVARSLSLSRSQFPRLSDGGICLRRAPGILSTDSLEDKDCDKTGCRTALCSERSQTSSLMWTPTLCASSGQVTSGHELGLLHHPGRETDRVILLPKVKWESGRPVRLDLNLENVHIKHH